MSSVLPTRALGLVLALLATGGAMLVSCTPIAPGQPINPARGCYDNQIGGEPDAYYWGEPSEVANLEYRSSTDGTCTGAPVVRPDEDSMLIAAADVPSADVLCRMLAGAPARGLLDELSGPWAPTFGPGAFICEPLRPTWTDFVGKRRPGSRWSRSPPMQRPIPSDHD